MPVLMSGTQRRPFEGLLDQLAMRTLSGLAGRELDEVDLPEQDLVEDRRPLAPRGTLSEILSGEQFDSLPEWLELCGERRIHPALLPAAMQWGQGPRFLQAIGPRGLWLMQQNPEWHDLLSASSAAEVWETGTPRQRAEWLAAQEPEPALELLRAVWKQENAETRALLLASLKEREALELGLSDRSKKVRTVAAQGLWRFADHPLVIEWLETLARDQPPAASPGFELTFWGLGEKAGWLAQLAALAPLGAFQVPRGEWRDALMQGFSRATLAQQRQDWALGLLRAGSQEEELFRLLSWEDRETLLLSGPPAWEWYGLHRPFSPALAAKVWRELQILTQGRHDWDTAKALRSLAHGFSVKLSLEQGWPEGSPHWRYWNSAVEKMLELHSFRRRMHEEMA